MAVHTQCTPMAKGYPVRPEGVAKPECHHCGSLRLSKLDPQHPGQQRCLDCGAMLLEDPFAIS